MSGEKSGGGGGGGKRSAAVYTLGPDMTARQLRDWRRARGYTQPALAVAVCVHKSTLWRWESEQIELPENLWLTLRGLESRGDVRAARASKARKAGSKR